MFEYDSAMSIGTSYTPSTTTHKYVKIKNACIDGSLVAPSTTLDVYMGDTVTDSSTLINSSIMIASANRVAPDKTYVEFDVTAQIVYTREGSGTQMLIDTKTFTIRINTPVPAGMTNFDVSGLFVPMITSFNGNSTLIVDRPGGKRIHMDLVMGTFDIPASGNACVKVPLAIPSV